MRNFKTRCFDVKLGRSDDPMGFYSAPLSLVVVADSFEEASAAAVELVNAWRESSKADGCKVYGEEPEAPPYTRHDVLEITVTRNGAIVASERTKFPPHGR